MSKHNYRVNPISADEKARLTKAWEQNPKLHSPKEIMNVFDYAAGVCRSSRDQQNFDKLSTFGYLWCEYLVRNHGWEWAQFTREDGGSVATLAILSKDRKNLIAIDILCVSAAQGEVESWILEPLFRQITNNEPLKKVTGVINLGDEG